MTSPALEHYLGVENMSRNGTSPVLLLASVTHLRHVSCHIRTMDVIRLSHITVIKACQHLVLQDNNFRSRQRCRWRLRCSDVTQPSLGRTEVAEHAQLMHRTHAFCMFVFVGLAMSGCQMDVRNVWPRVGLYPLKWPEDRPKV